MNDPRETLARIRKQADAATEGPWEAFGTVIDAFTGPGDCLGCSGILSPAHEPACYYSEIAGAGEQDAKFIAAARTTVPALLDLADAVFDLHRRSDHTRLVGFPRADREEHYCMEDQKPWPCPTFTATTTALEKIA